MRDGSEDTWLDWTLVGGMVGCFVVAFLGNIL
jgi:hypothetical protein